MNGHARGAHAEVVRGGEVLRAGTVGWNELANRTTGLALERRRAAGRPDPEPAPGQQLTIS